MNQAPPPSPAPVAAYVALGSNLQDPERQVRAAIAELAQLPSSRLIRASRLFRTAPVGPPGQPDYVNAVVCLQTRLDARALLHSLHAIEAAHGRFRDGTRWGPRILDLDILLYGELRLDEPGLTIPHPQMAVRAFVLVPLAEVAPPQLIIPDGDGHESPLAGLVAGCDRAGITPLASNP